MCTFRQIQRQLILRQTGSGTDVNEDPVKNKQSNTLAKYLNLIDIFAHRYYCNEWRLFTKVAADLYLLSFCVVRPLFVACQFRSGFG